MIYKELDFEEKQKRAKITIFILLSVIILRIIFNGGIQQLEYYSYKMKQDRYIICQAVILDKEDISWYIGKLKLVPNSKEKIEYEVDGEVYTKKVFSYPEYGVDEIIPIAVDADNNIKRCIPYPIWNRPSDIINCVLFLVLFILGINVQNIAEGIHRVKNRKIQKEIQKEQNNKQESDAYQITKKKLCIMSIVQGCEEVPFDKELVMKLDNPIHEDFIWCLKYLSKTNVADDILLLHMNTGGDYEFVAETIRLRQEGLPEQYYVITIADNNYLCGSADSHRVYCFSQSLGVTNTQYATIFDYVIEKIGL